ncbi:hypothetical protein ACHAXT_006478 [Thalassiosira profunda]
MRRQPSSISRRCKRATILLLLAALVRPASAIGGWDPIHNIMARLSGQRAKSEESNPPRGNKSPQERIAPVPNGGSSDKKDEGAGGGGAKRHVGEVTMTKGKSQTSSRDAAEETGPAFIPRGRRGGLHLDENDLRTITFVGRSNPFL